MKRRTQAGVTLLEVLIAVTLLSLLSVGMLFAMRVGLNAWGKANDRLMSNRRVTGAHRVLESQIAGLMPVFMHCRPGQPGLGLKRYFFQGEPQSMRFVSAYSLQEAWRGVPRILEYQVIARDQGGYRLIVNEIPYTGPEGAGASCLGIVPGYPAAARVQFRPIEPGPGSFVLADRLAYCRFSYLETPPPPKPPVWHAEWALRSWPRAVRVEIAGLDSEKTAVLRPVTLVAPIRVQRDPEIQYVDQ